jgi:hypothetical protein
MKIIINEFSTGIKVVGTADNWHSQGFTENYLNKTVDKVPSAIELAIANKLFSVAEGGALEKPSLIAREIQDEQGEWSVVSVVTRAVDEGNRPLPTYRYFFSSGLGKISFILRWWIEHRPIFNPYDVKYPGDEIECEVENIEIPTTNFEDLLNNNIPIIFPSNRTVNELIISAIAERVSEKSNQLVAWAYRVMALETSNSFQIIFPANEQSEEVLRRVLSQKSNMNNVVQDESAIKKAISLLSQNKVKPEHLKTIEDALANPAIDDKYWRSMFDSQGAGDALKQGNYGHSMIRLLTLQAMVLPETLLPFLKWLMAKEKKTDNYDISGDFQSKIVKYQCPNLSDRIYEGVVSIIPELLIDNDLLISLVWFLKSKTLCWGSEYHKNVQCDLEHDFAYLKQCSRNRKYENIIFVEQKKWKNIYDDIVPCYAYSRFRKKKEYQVLGILFEKIGSYQISALFYHVSLGYVPPDVFSNLKGADRYGKHIENEVYGLTVKKQLNLAEKFWYKELLGENEMRLPIFTFIFIICYVIGWFGGFWSNKYIFSNAEKSMNVASKHLSDELNKGDDELNKGDDGIKEVRENLIAFFSNSEELADEKNADLSDSLACIVDPKSDVKFCGVSKDKLVVAVNKFSDTEKGIKAIKNEMLKIKNEDTKVNYTETESVDYIAGKLGIGSQQLQNLSGADKKKTAYRIYKYQEDQGISPPSGILDKKTQDQILKPIKPIANSQ